MAKPSATDKTRDQLTNWNKADMARWEPRNLRFQRDQELFQLQRPPDATSWVRQDSDILVLNDPKVLVKKVARIIARHPNNIDIVAANGQLSAVAQRIENYLYSWDQAVNQRWMKGLHNPYRYDQAFTLLLRGWLCERTMLYPDLAPDPSDPSALYHHQVIDPVTVYPAISGDHITRVTHAYSCLVGDVREDPAFADIKKDLDEREDSSRLNVRATYWESEGSWWHAITIDGEDWAKKPVELGYFPWTIVLANGVSYRATPWDENDYFEQIGTGLLDESAENQKYLNRIATKLNALLTLEANPPVIIYGDGTVKKVDLTAGGRTFLTTKDKVEVTRSGPNFADFQLLWNILTERADRAGLPKQFFGEAAETGFATSIVMSAGKDVLFPFVEAINQADALKYRKVLELYRDFGPGQPLMARMPPDSLGASSTAEITAEDITQQGTYVEVSRVDMTPQELAQKINLALAMVRDKAISLETARGKDWIGLKNPSRENLQVLAEQVYMDPQVMRQLVPLALGDTGQGLLAAIWSAVQNGVPGVGAPAQPPGLPSQTLPPVMQSGNLMESQRTGEADILALLGGLSGGAVGGAGLGGAPPPFGSTSPVTPPPNGY